MQWDEIMNYYKIIQYIARKYSGDPDLAEDVTQEVMLRLFDDKKLNTSKFDPTKKDAAIRQTIRNKVIKVLRSKKVGRWVVDSLDQLKEEGYQIDTSGNLIQDPIFKNPYPVEHDDRE